MQATKRNPKLSVTSIVTLRVKLKFVTKKNFNYCSFMQIVQTHAMKVELT